MARGFNALRLVGTITMPPTLKYTNSGLSIMELSLSGIDSVTGNDGVVRDLTWYHRVTIFGRQAEYLNETLAVGMPVFVDGRLNYQSWEGDNGQKRSALNINGIRVDALTFGPREEASATIQDAKGQHRLVNAVNEVTLIGNLIKDAEVRYIPSGDAVCSLVLAVNEQYKDKQGGDKESVHFVEITAWRELAEACAKLVKGDPIMASGRFVTDSWNNRDGGKSFKNKVEANRVEFLVRGSPSNAPTSPKPNTRPQTSATTPGLDIDEEFPPEEDLPF